MVQRGGFSAADLPERRGTMGGKPSKGTKKDKRLKSNKTTKKSNKKRLAP